MVTFPLIPAFVAGDSIKIDPPIKGSVRAEKWLAVRGRDYQVISHPRCSNCRVGADNRPMWSGPSYCKTHPRGRRLCR